MISYLESMGIDTTKALEYLGDEETYASMLKDFLSEIEAKVNRLNEDYTSGNMKSFSIDVHSLKSDSRYLGFTKLAEMALIEENKSKENDYEFIKKDYPNLIKELQRIINIIAEGLSKENASEIKLSSNYSNNSKKMILVVDDSHTISHFITSVFNDKYDVAVALDGGEALNVINSSDHSDIVGMLLDLNMPNVNGFEVLNFMKKNNLLEDMPVVVITGLEKGSIENSLKEYNVVDVLYKPFSAEELKSAIASCEKF